MSIIAEHTRHVTIGSPRSSFALYGGGSSSGPIEDVVVVWGCWLTSEIVLYSLSVPFMWDKLDCLLYTKYKIFPYNHHKHESSSFAHNLSETFFSQLRCVELITEFFFHSSLWKRTLRSLFVFIDELNIWVVENHIIYLLSRCPQLDFDFHCSIAAVFHPCFVPCMIICYKKWFTLETDSSREARWDPFRMRWWSFSCRLKNTLFLDFFVVDFDLNWNAWKLQVFNTFDLN